MSYENFGSKSKLEFFHLNPDVTFTNHGSYGSVPKEIFQHKISLQHEMESCPDQWFRLTSINLWNKNIDSLAKYLGVESKNLVLCVNATEAINTVLKAIDLNPCQDAILATEFTYKAILNTIEYTSSYKMLEKIEVVMVPVKFPIKSSKSMIEKFDEACQLIREKKLKIKLAIIDHISSATAMKFPITEIGAVIRKYNDEAIIVIDGAHSIGQIELNLEEYNCDFYVSNLHKWFLSPRGCSFLYIKNKENFEKILQPCYISHGYEKGISSNFFERGTMDKTSWFLVDMCIDFYENKLGGLRNISNYNKEMLDQAVQLFTENWGTKKLEMPVEMEAPFMKVIELPELKDYQVKDLKNHHLVCENIMKEIFIRYKIVSCIVYLQNKLHCRISCFVYNTFDDFVKLNNAIMEMKK